MDTRSGSDIDYLISISHDIFVMFDNYHRVSEVYQFSQIIEEESAVSWVESDRRLIQDIGDSFESRTHLCREPDTLRFTT